MLLALLQAIKDEPGGARLIAGLEIPFFKESRSESSWRFASASTTSLALDGGLLAQVPPSPPAHRASAVLKSCMRNAAPTTAVRSGCSA